MDNYILNTGAGDTFEVVARKARVAAIELNVIVEFDFNGIKCLVNGLTNTDWLYRDYSNSSTMGWKEVGPDCVENYSADIQSELDHKNEANEIRRRNEQAESDRKDAEEKAAFEETVKGIEMELVDSKTWEEGKALNNDPYGAAIYVYAESWARLMQKEIDNGAKLVDIASPTSFKLGFMGITGFMYGAAVSILSKCWVHGEQLRKWHNKGYKHEGEGVVNPAMLTISTK